MYIEVSSLLFSLSTALDYVEQDVVGVSTNHCRRVACLSKHLCKTLGMSDEDSMDMAICAILHDSALTEMFLEGASHGEDVSLERHCNLGEQNAKRFPFFHGDVSNVILWHHENWDGSGYFKLKGDEICDRAAILRLADNTDLRFRLAQSTESSRKNLFEHLTEQRGKLYAPHVVDAFFDSVDTDFLLSLQDEQIANTIKTTFVPEVQKVCIKDLLSLGCVFSNIIDSKSAFTSNHSQGIVRIAEIMGNYYGFSEEHIGKIMLAAHLHDVGKLMVPSEILEKEGPLNAEEFEIMKGHAMGTYNMLSMVNGMEVICEWASRHHEKLDGTGYPLHLDMMEMTFEARLIGCADIYQALTEDRPYRKGMSHEQSMQVLKDLAAKGKIEAAIVEDMDKVLQGDVAKSFVQKKCGENH